MDEITVTPILESTRIDDLVDGSNCLADLSETTNISEAEFVISEEIVNDTVFAGRSDDNNNNVYNVPTLYQEFLDISKVIFVNESNESESQIFTMSNTFVESSGELSAPVSRNIELLQTNTQKTCDICQKHFLNKSSLTRHIKTLHSENHKEQGHDKSYKCNSCDKEYKTFDGLYIHLRCHNNEYKYICQHCGLQFQYKSMFDSHLAKHSENKKPYKCNKCEKCFTHISNLSKHTKICGITTKDFSCDICGKRFKTKRYQKVHLNSMHLLAEPTASDFNTSMPFIKGFCRTHLRQ